MLARAIATSFDGTFKRIQFTPDLPPADVTAVDVYGQGPSSSSSTRGRSSPMSSSAMRSTARCRRPRCLDGGTAGLRRRDDPC
nr:AAA family ATPase [Halapricum desulfuricans]